MRGTSTIRSTGLASIAARTSKSQDRHSELEQILESLDQVKDVSKELQAQLASLLSHSRRVEHKLDRLASDQANDSRLDVGFFRPKRASLVQERIAASSSLQSLQSPTHHSGIETPPRNGGVGDFSENEGIQHASLPENWPASTKPRPGLIFNKKRSRRALFGKSASTADARETLYGGGNDNRSLVLVPTTSDSVEEAPVAAGGLSKYCVALDPNSNARVLYDFAMVLICAVDLTATPYTVAWNVPMTGATCVWAWVSLMFWMCDILVNFITGFYIEGELEMKLAEIARAYMKGYFFLDIMICVGQLVTMALDHTGLGLRTVLFTRILRLFRMFRLVRLARTMKIFFMQKRPDHVNIAIHCIALTVAILWIAHVLACSWYAVGRGAISDTGEHWIDEMGEHSETLWYQYLTAYHFSLQQLAAGSMDMRPTNSFERYFNIVCLVFGWLGGSSIVASLSTVMIEAQSHWKERTRKLEVLQQFLEQNDVQHQFSIRVQNQVLNKADKEQRIPEERVQLLAFLSPALKAELYEHMYGSHVMNLPLFRVWAFLDPSGFRSLCGKAMQMTTYSFAEPLFEAGSASDCCYLLVSGRLEYVQRPDSAMVEEEVVREVDEEGSVLSEACLWSLWKHVGTCEALVDSAVLVLEAHAFAQAVAQSKEAQDFCFEYGRLYYERLAHSTHPHHPWPTDLGVAETGFEDIVMAMDFGWRRMSSLSAFSAFEKRWNTGIFRMRKGIEELREEVVSGKCTLIQDGKGDIMRMVAVTVLKLNNAEGEIWTQVGKFENDEDEMSVSVKLPGAKLSKGEVVADALPNMLAKVLPPLANGIELLNVRHEHTSGKSGTFDVATKYVRMIHETKLKENFEIEPDGDVCSIVNLGSKAAYVIQDDEGRYLVYCWLSPEEFAKFSGPSEQARQELLRLLDPLIVDDVMQYSTPLDSSSTPILHQFSRTLRI